MKFTLTTERGTVVTVQPKTTAIAWDTGEVSTKPSHLWPIVNEERLRLDGIKSADVGIVLALIDKMIFVANSIRE